MDTVLGKISEIESAATSIMEDANVRKKEYAKEIEERTAAFDARLEEDTNRKLEELRTRMEIDMKKQLEQQKNDAETILKNMEDNYNKNHEIFAKNLFQKMVRE